MQRTLHILSPNHYWEAIHGNLRQRFAKKHLPSEKIGFSFFFAKNWPAGKFQQPKISAPVNYKVAKAAKQKENGSSKRVVERDIKRLERQ